MTAMVRAQSLRGYRELVSDLGGDPDGLLRSSDIDPADLNQLTAFISFENAVILLERSAAELGCLDFGLRLADRQDIGVLDTLAVAMRYSATVGAAARCASHYLHVHNRAVAFKIVTSERSSQVQFEFGVHVDHAPRWVQAAEHGVGLASRIMVLLSEGRCHLQHVRFPHPALSDIARYRSRFDAPLTFKADRLALTYAARDLDLVVSESNEELHDIAASYLDRQLPSADQPVAVQVHNAVEALLGTGTCSYQTVARSLYMHPRTLQRRLHEEGTTFEAIKDDARRDLARRYLAQPNLPLVQVSGLLDYSEQSALGRSCRRWFHATPRALRQDLSSAARPSSSVA
jgi:AraC-like DNA-binding protein